MPSSVSPSDRVESIILGFLVGSSLRVPVIVSPPNLTVYLFPSMARLHDLRSSSEDLLPSFSPAVIAQAPWSFFRSPFGLSAPASRQITTTIATFFHMVQLQGQGKHQVISLGLPPPGVNDNSGHGYSQETVVCDAGL